MNVAILGYSVDGASSAAYWHKLGADVTICDEKTDLLLPDYAKQKVGPDYLSNLDSFDLLVRTSGMRPDKITQANPDAPDILKKTTTTINEFLSRCPAPVIGVTGTKGKGTTCMLIYKMLEAAGHKVFLGGNIGTVPLDFLQEVTPDSWVILELSSFQLMDLNYAPHIGVCVMVVPEHLNWHNDLSEYYQAKQNLFARQTDQDIAVFNAGNLISKKITNVSPGQKIPYIVPPLKQSMHTNVGAYVDADQIFMNGSPVCKITDVALLGRHNLENVCAAIAAVWQIINKDVHVIQKVVKEFSGMEHRLEFVRELNDVKYYNDSFATTPEATVAAIKSFEQPKVVILGGSDKGIPFFSVVNEVLNGNVRRVIIIGQTGKKLIELLVSRGYENITLGGNTMDEIVVAAKREAQPGDVVLLSTACASFGLFKDYKDRGNQFKDIVNSL